VPTGNKIKYYFANSSFFTFEKTNGVANSTNLNLRKEFNDNFEISYEKGLHIYHRRINHDWGIISNIDSVPVYSSIDGYNWVYRGIYGEGFSEGIFDEWLAYDIADDSSTVVDVYEASVDVFDYSTSFSSCSDVLEKKSWCPKWLLQVTKWCRCIL